MPIQAQFHAPRGVAADFDEQWAEVRVIDIEIVVVHIHGFVALEFKTSVHLFPAECLGFLLGYPNEDDPVPHLPFLGQSIGDIILPLLMLVGWRSKTSLGLISETNVKKSRSDWLTRRLLPGGRSHLRARNKRKTGLFKLAFPELQWKP